LLVIPANTVERENVFLWNNHYISILLIYLQDLMKHFAMSALSIRKDLLLFVFVILISNITLAQRDFDQLMYVIKTETGIKKAHKRYNMAKPKTGFANALLVDAKLLHSQGEKQNTLTLINSTLKTGEEKAGETGLPMNTPNLIDLYFMESGKKKKTPEHYRNNRGLREKIYNEMNYFSLAKFLLKEEKNQLEKSNEQKNDLLKAAEQKYKVFRFLWLIVILLFLITIAYFLKNKEKRQTLFNQTLAKDSKRELIQRMRTEHNSQIIKSNLKDKVDESTIDKVIKDLNLSSNNTFDEDFLMIYHKTDEEFFPKLRRKYPCLTKHDQVLCGMIRMGLDSKQIAHITFRSPQSIHVARSRLRKKLVMMAKQDLGLYLQRI